MSSKAATHLCDIEKGRKVVSPERAARFARVLGRSAEQFVRLSLQGLVDQAGLKMRVNVVMQPSYCPNPCRCGELPTVC